MDAIIPNDYILASLDVRSSFTNVPCELVINSVDRRFDIIHKKIKIPYTVIIDTVKFLFKNTFPIR